MTSSDDELWDRINRATPGPWEAVMGGVRTGVLGTTAVVDPGRQAVMRTRDGDLEDGTIGAVCMTRGKYEREMDNAQFIAAAREALPEALHRINRLRIVVGAAQRAVDQMRRLVGDKAPRLMLELESTFKELEAGDMPAGHPAVRHLAPDTPE